MLITLFIFFLWLIVVCARLNYPIFSVEELRYVPTFLLSLISPQNLWTLRIITVGGVFLFLMHICRYFKLKPLALLALVTSPWIYVMAREFNILSIITLLLITFLFTKTHRRIVLLLFSFLILYLISHHHDLSMPYLAIRFEQLKEYASFIDPFFQTERGKFYLLLPKIGHFLYPSLLFLIAGLITYRPPALLSLLASAVIVYVFFPSNYFIFAGIGFIFIFTIFILKGVDRLPHSRYFQLLICCLIIINFTFFLEVYFGHYQIKYGGERKYAEQNIVIYMTQNKFGHVYSIPNGDIEKWYQVYTYHYSLPSFTTVHYPENWTSLRNACFDTHTLCIVDKEILTIFNATENDPRIKRITDPNGLNRYYLL